MEIIYPCRYASKIFNIQGADFILPGIKKAVIVIFVAFFIMLTHTAHIGFAQEVTGPEYRIILNGQHIHPPFKPLESNNDILLPLCYISEIVGAVVTWDSAGETAIISYENNQTAYKCLLINNTMTVPLKFLAGVFNARSTVNNKLGLIIINTGDKTVSEQEALTLLPSYNGYTEEDLNWLAKIVEAEAQGETYPSKLGVASVIINRRNSGQYPKTIKGVIFDKKYGVQFTPTANGSVYNTPSQSSFIAAMEALEGRNNAPKTLFFLNPDIATSSWIPNNRQYAFTIGGHSYYY